MVDIRKYNGYLTVANPKTGNHRTFKIETVQKGPLQGKRILSLLVGPDNTESYRGFAFVTEDGQVRVWKKFKGTEFDKLARIVEESGRFEKEHGLIYMMSVKCRKCNRDLTDPESIDLGIGPICRQAA